MKYNHLSWVSGLLLTLLSSFECSKQSIAAPAEIKATAYSPTIPVLKGLSANPVLRIAVSIPEGNAAQHYSKLACSLNPEAIGSIQKIDVYITGAGPFSTQNLAATFSPSTGLFEIPVNATLNAGIHFIWFSLVLKDEEATVDKITFNCSQLVTGAGKTVQVDQGKNDLVKRTGVAIRRAGDDEVHTYRIPGMVQTEKGTLVAVYDIRYTTDRDLPGNIDVGMSRSTNGGKTWEPMKVIMDMGAPHENNGIGDPAILFDPQTKKIWVAALWSKGNRSIAGSLPGLSPDTTGQFVLVSSADDGLTWSQPINITNQVKNPAWRLFFNGPGSGIAMQDGKLVFAAQYWDENKLPHSTLIYSGDHGLSWNGKINGPKTNTTEAQVVETKPGTIMLNMRDNRGRFRSVATTSSFGASWTEHGTSYNALPDPVCMGSIIKARVMVKGVMKDVLFFSNPNTSSGRTHITIKASLDLGETWLPANELLVDERLCYGYSSLSTLDENTIAVLYEGIRDLYFVTIPVADIIK